MLTGMPISDLARPDGAGVPVHDDRRADRIGRAQALHRHREVRDHGDPVLHPRRQLPHPRRGGEADDQLLHLHDRPLVRRHGPGRRSWPAPSSRRSPARRWPRSSRSARSCCRRWSRQGYPEALRRRRHHHLGRVGHPLPAVGQPRHLRHRHHRHERHRAEGRAGRARPRSAQLFLAGIVPGLVPVDPPRRHDLVPGEKVRLPAPAAGVVGRALQGLPRELLGHRC